MEKFEHPSGVTYGDRGIMLKDRAGETIYLRPKTLRECMDAEYYYQIANFFWGGGSVGNYLVQCDPFRENIYKCLNVFGVEKPENLSVEQIQILLFGKIEGEGEGEVIQAFLWRLNYMDTPKWRAVPIRGTERNQRLALQISRLWSRLKFWEISKRSMSFQ